MSDPKPLPFIYQFAAGAVAGVSEILVMYPLDVVKTRVQLQTGTGSGADHYNGMVDCFKKIVRNEGASRLYRGITAPILMEAPKRATKFAANDSWGKFYREAFGIAKMNQSLSILTGASAGATEAFVVVPFELVKIRLQNKASASLYSGPLDVVKKTIANEGVFALYNGLESTLWRHILWNAGYFGVIFQVRSLLPKAQTKQGQISNDIIAGSIGGTVGTILNTPMDVVKSRIQNSPKVAGSVPKYNWAWPAVMTVAKEEGFAALYKGFLPKVLRLGPGGGILLVVYTGVMDFFRRLQKKSQLVAVSQIDLRRVLLARMALFATARHNGLMALVALTTIVAPILAYSNSSYYNPILPGFHPDPSCIFVPEWDNTFFCASSSFNAFPGIPIHASKDLQNWKLIGNALNRKEQLPRLAETNRSTSGIWAPALRFHGDVFYVVTTLVDDDRAADDSSRWDNVIFKADNPYEPLSWTNAIHFDFVGYDTSPFWDVDGQVYMTGSHAYHVFPGIQQAEANLDTGEVGEWVTIWNGTGGLVGPVLSVDWAYSADLSVGTRGPHIYFKDGYYYLLAAEVQTLGHADLFQDQTGNWWAVALSTRSGPDYLNYPMGRETVLTPVTWAEGKFPVFIAVSGEMSGWPLPLTSFDIYGEGPFINEGDTVDFEPNSTLPAHFTYWRYPVPESYVISPPDHPNTLRLNPSSFNLTALNGNYAGPAGQTFVGRRQQSTLFTYSVNLEFSPKLLEEEAGVSVFLTQNHHLDLGIVMLPANSSTAPFPGTNTTESLDDPPTLDFVGYHTLLFRIHPS
ncbi:Non-reducing end alpha-L-arabinofuranosidase BoGH43A 7 [Seiridium cupressi]